MTSDQIKLYLFLSLCPFFMISNYQCMMVKIYFSEKKPHGQGEDLIYISLKFKFKHLNFHRFHQAMQPKPINYTFLFYLLNPFFFYHPSHINNILTLGRDTEPRSCPIEQKVG